MSGNIHPWNQTLWQQLTQDPERSAHALLFTSGRGLGKRLLAEHLSDYILCDGNLSHQQLFKAGSHPDFYVLRPENEVENHKALDPDLLDLSPALSNTYAARLIPQHAGKPKQAISIDQVRMLTPMLATYPHISKHRVVIVDHAEKMNTNAANALLKSLEEPPANTLFILISDRPDRLPATIRSRCSLVAFTVPDLVSGAAWLSAQAKLAQDDVSAYMAMANNHPLQAWYFYKQSFRDATRALLQSVNNLWNKSMPVSQAAKEWQSLGAEVAIDMLQKLSADLLRVKVSGNSAGLFYPIQQSWLSKVGDRMDTIQLFELFDELGRMKRLITTTVDQQLVLESIGIKFTQLPLAQHA